MVTSYILILCLSAWFGAFAITAIAGRLTKVTSLPLGHMHGVIALLVTVAFFVVAAAPGWAMLLALILLAVPQARLTQPMPLAAPWVGILLALVPLALTPLMGAPSWVALDSALIASSIFGLVYARGITPIGRAFVPFIWLIVWLAFEAARHLLGGAAHAS